MIAAYPTTGDFLTSTGMQVSGHPVVGYAAITGGYATRLGSTGTSTLNETQIYAGGNFVATFQRGGNVGIGTTSPTGRLDVKAPTGNGNIAITTGTTTADSIRLNAGGSATNWLEYRGYLGHVWFDNVGERMRIDASGNLLVGTTDNSPVTSNVDGIVLKNNGQVQFSYTGTGVAMNRKGSDGNIIDFRKDGTSVGSIGTTTDNSRFRLLDTSNRGFVIRTANSETALEPSTTTAQDGYGSLGTSGARWKDLYLSGGLRGDTTFSNNAGTTEYARFDTSGNLLVGKTSASGSTVGGEIRATGAVLAVRDGDFAGYFNRKTSDGEIVRFVKDTTTVGSIGATGGDLFIGTGDVGLWFQDGGNAIRPFRVDTVAGHDNSISLGVATTGRFDDAFIVNGVTTGSDENDKQDIETLSDAEQRVAVACKGLLRKWRWKDAVEAKGDEARIHFGIIAQDLQAAFEAEGLDAGRYAMFMSNTWTDEETGEERTRLGVRYHELLAFIIAAI